LKLSPAGRDGQIASSIAVCEAPGCSARKAAYSVSRFRFVGSTEPPACSNPTDPNTRTTGENVVMTGLDGWSGDGCTLGS
jgi:hypothetical protein